MKRLGVRSLLCLRMGDADSQLMLDGSRLCHVPFAFGIPKPYPHACPHGPFSILSPHEIETLE